MTIFALPLVILQQFGFYYSLTWNFRQIITFPNPNLFSYYDKYFLYIRFWTIQHPLFPPVSRTFAVWWQRNIRNGFLTYLVTELIKNCAKKAMLDLPNLYFLLYPKTVYEKFKKILAEVNLSNYCILTTLICVWRYLYLYKCIKLWEVCFELYRVSHCRCPCR